MEFWLEVFSIVAAIALVVQVIILGALFFELKRTTEKVNKLVSDMQTRVGPILSRVQLLLDDTQPRISEMVADASHIVYLARGQAQKMDRVLSEASDRLRGQLIHADRILSGALEAVEETGAKVRQGFSGADAQSFRGGHGDSRGVGFVAVEACAAPAGRATRRGIVYLESGI